MFIPAAVFVRATLPCSICLVCATALASDATIEQLGIQHFQVIGTHNSYHLRPEAKSLAASVGANRGAQEWDYSHAPLDLQLDRGVRSFELDLHDTDDGLEVFHVPILDQGSTCQNFGDALSTIRQWSDAHPKHFPISVLIEVKDDVPRLARRLRPFDSDALERLDRAIRDAFPKERLLTPDDVRGDHSTLREAVLAGSWPSLANARGQVMFVLHEDGKLRDLYVGQRRSLEGRALFVRSAPDREDAATLVLDSPRDPRIAEMVRLGYLVRTRADSGLHGDASRRDAALASGAQIVSTDFPAGEADSKSGYVVEWPASAEARVNEVSAPKDLRGKLLGGND